MLLQDGEVFSTSGKRGIYFELVPPYYFKWEINL